MQKMWKDNILSRLLKEKARKKNDRFIRNCFDCACLSVDVADNHRRRQLGGRMSRYIDADKLNGYEFGLISPKAQDLFHKIINNAPEEDVKPIVRGEWICVCGSSAVCNKCNRLNQMYGDFCKYCGARMKKESEETE